jgi:transposase
MPAALPVPLRQQMAQLHAEGHRLTEIAQQLGVRYRTVRSWWRRYCQDGAAGLTPRYAHCGPRGPQNPALHQAALALKRAHPPWGAGLIRVELARQFPPETLPQARALQRWFRAAGLQPARAQQPAVPRQPGREAHAVWQVDAKERMRLADGSGTSVLTVTDEATGALLGVRPFPPLSLEPGAGGRGATGAAGALQPVGLAGADTGG